MKLQAPADSGDTCTHEGVDYEIRDGVVDLPPNAAEALRAHGFTDYTLPEGEDPDDLEAKLSPKDVTLGVIEKMNRPELLATIKQAGITFVGGRNNQQLRAMLREHIEEAPRRPAPQAKPEGPRPVEGADKAAPKTEAKPGDEAKGADGGKPADEA